MPQKDLLITSTQSVGQARFGPDTRSNTLFLQNAFVRVGDEMPCVTYAGVGATVVDKGELVGTVDGQTISDVRSTTS